MAVSYAGVKLVTADEGSTAWVENNISVKDVYEFEHPISDFGSIPHTEFLGHMVERPIRLGHLFWPVGASLWAVGHFLVTLAQLNLIREKVYPDGGVNKYAIQQLIVNDGKRGIGTNLWMLPPRPLAQISKNNQLFLLTLVDDRYFWWYRSGVISITEGTTTWTQLYSSIGTVLGVTITADTIPAAYLKPSGNFSAAHEYLPPILDAAAHGVGQRIVRSLDGTVRARNVVTSRDTMNAELLKADRKKLAGGTFNL